MKSITCFILIVVCVHVQSRQIFFEDSDFGNANGNNNNQQQQQQPTTPPSGSTTTTATPAYQRCFAECQTRVTKQYSPVCASNGQSFNNIRLLECARSCGLNAQYESHGTCGPSPGGK
ncbi:hypothetical protein PPYR_07997 [Photinus pyralis]|uniref:Kazal-like domain-containing protein n=1 Tax=Photinus pyralis TaxID=7054 RepID=A0A1Y1N846_PHOPY|nr:uncharacterized protein LOC116167590 [Photinus pyralis]KAB0800117.1 hypothetical protein PPYR_07997 [Photinus pyralis]